MLLAMAAIIIPLEAAIIHQSPIAAVLCIPGAAIWFFAGRKGNRIATEYVMDGAVDGAKAAINRYFEVARIMGGLPPAVQEIGTVTLAHGRAIQAQAVSCSDEEAIKINAEKLFELGMFSEASGVAHLQDGSWFAYGKSGDVITAHLLYQPTVHSLSMAKTEMDEYQIRSLPGYMEKN